MIKSPDLASQLERIPANRPAWLSYAIPWQDAPLLTWLEHAPHSPRMYWESSDQLLGLVGWGKAAEISDWGENRFHGVQVQAEYLAALLVPLNPYMPTQAAPHWFGSFSFQPLPADDPLWQSFPDAYFLLPRVQIARYQQQSWLTINLFVESMNDLQEIESYFEDQLARMHEISASLSEQTIRNLSTSAPQMKQGIAYETWQDMLNGALQRIQAGELKKVVLARTLQAQFEQPPSYSAILQNLAERYPDCYRFFIEPQEGQCFLGASPELLAEVCAPEFRSTALAGTIRRGVTPDEDQQLGDELLNSAKERQEHAIVVNTLDTKLRAIAEQVQIDPQPSLRKLGNLQHLETAIHGRLKPGWGVLDVIAALHPTPALGGWPREEAQKYISQAETFSRGWYAAPIGWFDTDGNGLFAVGIRSGLFIDKLATLFAGAGIVAGSNALQEWRETELKFAPLLQAIQGVIEHE